MPYTGSAEGGVQQNLDTEHQIPQIYLPDVQYSFPNNPEIFLFKQQNIYMEVQFPGEVKYFFSHSQLFSSLPGMSGFLWSV